ncbi:MAG: hypothetical protein UIM24_01975 [Clostridia bacterium]|nr:hypothetical protein [Clostridia bacterium]
MNKKSTGRKAIKIFSVIVAVILVFAIAAVLAMRFVVLPQISQKLQSSGRDELAAIIDQNNNFGAFAMFGKLFSDKGMIEFVTNLDGEGASSVVDFIETIDEENESDPTPSPTQLPWHVEDSRNIPRTTPAPTPPAVPTPAPELPKNASSAYDRIAAAASKQEMADGFAIISKLEMGYIARLIAGGLTPKEKAELKNYVYSKLTKAEISRALNLYNKYKKYL